MHTAKYSSGKRATELVVLPSFVEKGEVFFGVEK